VAGRYLRAETIKLSIGTKIGKKFGVESWEMCIA